MAKPDLKEEAKRLYKEGNTVLSELAKKMGIPVGTLRSWKSRDKWDAQTSHLPPVPVAMRCNAENSIPEVEIVANTGLTDKQQLFCLYYVATPVAVNAYQKAFNCEYITARNNGYRLLQNDKIKATIKELKEAKMTRELLDADDIFASATRS